MTVQTRHKFKQTKAPSSAMRTTSGMVRPDVRLALLASSVIAHPSTRLVGAMLYRKQSLPVG